MLYVATFNSKCTRPLTFQRNKNQFFCDDAWKKKTGTHVRRRDDRLHDVPFGVNLRYDDDYY